MITILLIYSILCKKNLTLEKHDGEIRFVDFSGTVHDNLCHPHQHHITSPSGYPVKKDKNCVINPYNAE